MLQIVRSIYKMTGQMVRLPEDEDTPEKVVLFLIQRGWTTYMCGSELTRYSGIWT